MTKPEQDEKAIREFDGRANFKADDAIEIKLDEHFRRFGIGPVEAVRNFPVYARRIFLKKFLAHYEFFRMVIDLPGDIVELGVYRGVSLMTWANFMEIRNMGDRQKQVFGFDNFTGFGTMDAKDGKADPKVGKVESGFNSDPFEAILEDAIGIYDEDRFIPYKPRVKLVKGDIEQTIPKFVEDNPGLRISLLHFDCDMYCPTKAALEHLFPLVVKGGVVLFDEYGIRPWEGESRAVDEYFSGQNQVVKRLDWAPNPGGYLIKN